MFISSFQVKNYKSYYDSGQLNLTTGFNIITGQNNVGKTALLEALSLGKHFKVSPHRSLKTIPTPNSQFEQTSIINISLTVYKEELLELLLVPQSEFSIPWPAVNTPFANEIGYTTEGNTESLVRLKDYLLSQQKLIFNFQLEKKTADSENWYLSKFPSFGLYEAQGSTASRSFARFKVNTNKTIVFDTSHNGSNESEFGKNIGSVLRQRIYYFRAERFNAGVCNFGNNSVLESNAQNLAEVLNILQNNRSRFNRFNDAVKQILPQVKLISVRPYPSENQKLEVMVWPHDPATERADLAVPLNESGTGIGQVLAILYVVLNSDFPRTIIIDEPQSFLHRGAARKLIEILKQHTKHQFIIATHSPTIINAVNPNTITLIKQQDAESSLEVIDSTETKQLRVYLAEVGARLSDVFGADNILWVEGETEELCFPMILERVAEHRLMGTAIIGLKNTGDLEGRHAKIIFEIYNRLSGSESLLPPAIGFILDDEGRTAQQKSDFRKLSKDLAEFTPRRLYENYLLNPSAITAVVNSIEGFRNTPITETEVTSWLENKGKDKKYKGPREGKPDEPWIDYVHGAKVLEDLFDDLSEPNVPYDKITHSIALTEWLIENKPEDLQEIADLIVKIINKPQITS